VYKKVEIGGDMSLAEKIKELRAARNWSQADLAKHSGLDRGYIANLEGTKSVKRPSADAFLKLARALNIKPEELYKAAGYIKDVGDTRPRPETLQELVDKLRVACPQSVPVYPWEAFPFRMGDMVGPIDYVYIRQQKEARGCVEAYIVHGNWLEPKINDGDIIIVDREGAIENGDIVACLLNDEFHVLLVRKVANELWLEDRYGKYKFEQCQDAAPVIECIRRLK
jgi:transcriptional regulator with XRE-family HTH domain